jgi:hypothetical protein
LQWQCSPLSVAPRKVSVQHRADRHRTRKLLAARSGDARRRSDWRFVPDRAPRPEVEYRLNNLTYLTGDAVILPRHWFPPKEPESPGSPRVWGSPISLQRVSSSLDAAPLQAPTLRVTRPMSTSHWFPLSGTEKPRAILRGEAGLLVVESRVTANLATWSFWPSRFQDRCGNWCCDRSRLRHVVRGPYRAAMARFPSLVSGSAEGTGEALEPPVSGASLYLALRFCRVQCVGSSRSQITQLIFPLDWRHRQPTRYSSTVHGGGKLLHWR